jgi:hypothetical protein
LAGGGWQLEVHWGRGTSRELMREWCFLGSGVPVKQLRSQRKGMGVERERERDGVGEAGRTTSVPGVQPNLSHGTKC